MNKASAVAKGLAALIAIIGLLVGVPALLTVLVGFPVEDLRALAAGELMSDSNRIGLILRTGLVAIGWLAWAQLAWALVSEAIAALRGTVAGRLWVFPGVQPFARRLVAAAMLISAIGGSAPPSMASPVPLGIDQTSHVVEDFTSEDWTRLSLVTDDRLSLDHLGSPDGMVAPSAGHGRSSSGHRDQVGADAFHLVEPGDSFWSVAESHSGDGLRWKELRQANVGRTMDDGTVIGPRTEQLRPGWQLRIPASMTTDVGHGGDATTTVSLADPVPLPPMPAEAMRLTGAVGIGEGPAAAQPEEQWVVDQGDHLWSIAASTLADRLGRSATEDEIRPYWLELIELNRPNLAPPGDPDLIHPGEVMTLPSEPPLPPTTSRLDRDPSSSPIEGAPPMPPRARAAAPATAPTAVPESALPDSVVVSESAAPESTVPESTVPESAVPESAVPESAVVPESAAPESTVPESAVVPESAAPESTTVPEVAEPTEPVTSSAAAGSIRSSVEDSQGPGSEDGPSWGVYDIGSRRRVDLVLGGGGLLLASGALLALRRQRMYAMIHRPGGHRPGDPDPALRDMERLLLAEADEQRAKWIGAGLASLAGRPVWPGEEVAIPQLIEIDEGGLVAVFDRSDPMAAPLPWRADVESRVWHLPSSVDGEEIPAFDNQNPTPAVVSLSSSLLINLEAVGSLAIEGTRRLVDEVVNSLVHELANSVAADSVDVRLTFHVSGSDSLPLVHAQSPERITAEVERWVEGFDRRLSEAGVDTVYALRLLNPSEPIGPMVVVADPASLPVLADVLAAANRRRYPLALVLADSSGTSRHQQFAFGASLIVGAAAPVAPKRSVARRLGRSQPEEPITARLEPFGRTVEPVRLSSTAAHDLGLLLKAAVEPPMVEVRLASTPTAEPLPTVDDDWSPDTLPPLAHRIPISAPPLPPASTRLDPEQAADPGRSRSVASPSRPDPSSLRVIVLGDIVIEGVGPDALSSQQSALLAFLATAGPVGRDRIVEALWDGQVLSPSRFPNLLAELRARIGRHHLPESTNGKYSLVDVSCDLDDFEGHVAAAAAGADDRVRARHLVMALELVRGVPFTPPARRFWTWVGDHSHEAARVEALVSDAAMALAGLCRDQGDLDRARWACERGLVASPLDEQLIADLTRIYVESGRASAARRLVNNWESSVSRLDCGEPSDRPRLILTGRIPG